MRKPSFLKFKVLTLILCLLFQGQLLALDLGSFSDVFTNAPNTVNAYKALCSDQGQLSTGPLDDSQWENICEIVKESELCKHVSDEDKISCQDREEDQIDVASFGFFWNCLRALGSVLLHMVEFIKEAIFSAFGYVFDSDTRDEINQQAADIYDGLSLYIANEFAHLKEENPESSNAALYAKLSAGLLGDALSFLSDYVKESFVSLGCYHQDAREKKACEYVLNVTVPPASFFALYKLGPKAFKAAKSGLGGKGRRRVEVKDLAPDPDQDINKILELQSGVKPTNPRKKTPIKKLNEDYWKNDQPVMVTKGDQSFPITYSFDSEIPHSAVFNLIYSNPESTARLTALLRGLKVRQPTGNLGRTELVPYRIDRAELMRVLEKSDKQLNTFVLRRGVDPNKEFFDLTDLNASYVDDFMVPILKQYNKDKDITDLVAKNFDKKSVDEFFDSYRGLADEIFTKENVPAKATRDQMWIEMVHNSSEKNPLEFRNLMLERYRPLTNSASSHLHVGVPAIVSENKMLAISRAVETRIILANARSTASPGKLYATSYSTLNRGSGTANRSAGVVRMNYNRFSRPHKAHDLEIRQYNSMEEGMNNIALVGNMAKNQDRIKLIEMPGLTKIDDPSTSNLTGALTYAARALEKSGNQELISKAGVLDEMVEEIIKAGKITPVHRQRVQDILKEHKILESLTEDILLEGS